MKVAVCISGQIRNHQDKCLDSIKHHFNQYDFFWGLWKSQANLAYDTNRTIFFDDPILETKYHLDQFGNQTTKQVNPGHQIQIKIHSELLKRIDPSYDMIIRLRPDTILSNKVDFNSLLEESYLTDRVFGFSTIFHNDINKPIEKLNFVKREIPYPINKNKPLPNFLYDYMIFHKRHHLNHKRIDFFMKNHILWSNEEGWYQVLSKQNGDNHVCFHGGVQITKRFSQ